MSCWALGWRGSWDPRARCSIWRLTEEVDDAGKRGAEGEEEEDEEEKEREDDEEEDREPKSCGCRCVICAWMLT